MEWFRGEYTVTTERERIQRTIVIDYIVNRSYWGKGRTQEQMNRAIDNSICFSLFRVDAQIGFARVITDYGTMFYLADVFVLEERRNMGLGKWLVECVLDYPPIRNLKGMLNTKDAHSLYEKYGFKILDDPHSTMIRRP